MRMSTLKLRAGAMAFCMLSVVVFAAPPAGASYGVNIGNGKSPSSLTPGEKLTLSAPGFEAGRVVVVLFFDHRAGERGQWSRLDDVRAAGNERATADITIPKSAKLGHERILEFLGYDRSGRRHIARLYISLV